MNKNIEIETKALIKKNKKSESSSSSSDSDNNNLSFYNDDKYNPSRINENLRNVIANHYNLGRDTLNLIENAAGGNCLYYSISFHCYNNFNHHREIRKIIANKLNERALQMPMVTITNNLGENIPIRDYAVNVYNDGEWGGDAEISMIPLVFPDITVVTYKMEKHEINDIILGYRFIQIYGNLNDPNTSILILININDNHWNTTFYNKNINIPESSYNIPNASVYDVKKILR